MGVEGEDGCVAEKVQESRWQQLIPEVEWDALEEGRSSTIAAGGRK